MHDTYDLASKTVEEEVHDFDCPLYDLMTKKIDFLHENQAHLAGLLPDQKSCSRTLTQGGKATMIFYQLTFVWSKIFDHDNSQNVNITMIIDQMVKLSTMTLAKIQTCVILHMFALTMCAWPNNTVHLDPR